MAKFLMKMNELEAMEKKVVNEVGHEKLSVLSSIRMGHSLWCGCGAGGNCSSSCVSGCADRG